MKTVGTQAPRIGSAKGSPSSAMPPLPKHNVEAVMGSSHIYIYMYIYIERDRDRDRDRD